MRHGESVAPASAGSVRKFFSSVPVFQFLGYFGFVLAFVQSGLLIDHMRLAQLTLLGITGTVILTFYALMMITKIVAGEEIIIYYHHEIAVIATCALFLRLTRQPVLPYLDVLVLGLGVFLACGRIGCLMVGCCHGRPCKWGVCYRSDHADRGFPRHLVGVKLFPIQAVESALALCTVGFGLVLLFGKHEPGSVLQFYIIIYGCGRFCLEFFRGDAARPYHFGFSEAQWISLILAVAVVIGERAHILPPSKWHWLAAVSMGGWMILVSVWRRLDRFHRFELLHPHHLREVAIALNHLGRSSVGIIHVVRTSRGYQLSIGETAGTAGQIRHYSLSREDGSLCLRGATIMARLIAHFERRAGSFTLLPGSAGVFHVLWSPTAAPVEKLRTLPDCPQPMFQRAPINSGTPASFV
jgi:hypothetical protein